MKFKIINSDQGHNYTHYVDAPDRETAMKRFKAGHYGSIVDCEEVAEDKKAPVLAEEILKSKFIVDGKTYYEWPNIRNRNDIYPKILEAMQKYAESYSRERVEALEEKVQGLEILLKAAKRGIEGKKNIPN